MIQDKIFFDEKDPTGLSYNTPFTYYGSYQGRLWSKSPSGSIKYYTQNSDLSAYATTGSNQFSGSQTITGSLTVTGTITGTVAGTTATASYVEYTNVANKPALISGSSQVTYSGLTGIPSGIVSGSSQVTYSGLTGIPSGIVSGSSQIAALGFATTGSNTFQANQTITGSLFITQNLVVAGSSSIQYISSSVLDIADNIITVNAFNPGVRFGGLAVIDSGSSPQVSGSLLFDSIKDQWIFVHQNQAVVTSSVVLMGPETYNSLGNETYLSTNRLPKGSGIEHLRDSNITDTGTVVSVNSNTQVTGSLTVTGLVGIGIVPSAWDTSVFPDVLQVGNGSVSNNGGAFTQFANNIYYDGSNYRYISTGGAQRLIYNTDGTIVFENAASGTGGNTFTFSERMRITPGGHVGIKIVPNSGWGSAMAALQIGTGGVIDNWTGGDSTMSVGVNYYDNGSGSQLRLYAKGASKIGFNQNVISFSNVGADSAGSTITWAERMSINGDGNLRINNLTTGAVYSNSGTLTNAAPLITATGGTIVTTGGFKYHTFTSSGTFQVTAGSGLIEVFVLGGGGAGGGDSSGSTFYAGGGGSGGGLYHPAYYVEVGSYTVTVGAGGTPNVLSNGFGGDGNNSVFGNITALGGGGGSRGNSDSSNSQVGRNGGSGGGGGSSNGVGGTSTQSITNGVAYGNSGANGAGIGGGGGGLGTQPVNNGYGGRGRFILNQANRIGGGGGAGVFSIGDLGSGVSNGNDGGGTGGYWNGSNSSNSSGTAGTANTGGGGGGLGYNVGIGGAGGSGIVIVKYKV